ncbi:hypothetical protein VTN00DRAFT_6258 [Thermoascus crustaceus]|uniref:uncharacterized protein n=1 Tax=Thermoascus crustaceus TaxID=5088 RepID=UPI0037445D7F
MSESTTAPQKPVHTIVLDAGPILKNIPPLSTLLAQSEELVTTPSVINEIRDPDARARVETMYLPFVKQRSPTPNSVKILSEFARKTGDRAVLSKVDIEVLALAYEIECERNGGDWRLRSVPGQKGLNGKPPVKVEEKKDEPEPSQGEEKTEGTEFDKITKDLESTKLDDEKNAGEKDGGASAEGNVAAEVVANDPAVSQETQEPEAQEVQEAEEEEADDSGSEGGWITPSNIKKRQARDEASSASATPEPKVMQVATMTTDFACQNVLLQMNLNLLSTTTLQRIRHLKTYIKRCHACFCTTKEMNRQFCPRCGKDTLTRVSCSTDANGQFKLHLKKNMQWNTRGNRYSVPKPVHGNASGKWKGGGGQGGWGTNLILAEDQKEYVRAVSEEQRRQRKERDLMDEDYLPGILTGERNRTGGRIRVGAGRNVNSRKR